MKRMLMACCVWLFIIVLLAPHLALAVGDGNVDGGGGGMGSGTGTNFWSNGDEGIRVSVIRSGDGVTVTTPVDFTNKQPYIEGHFGKVSKSSYRDETGLMPDTSLYTFYNPAEELPPIISTAGGNGNIEAIRSYFTDEQIIRKIAFLTGMDYDVLINGDYKILLEPIAYMTFQGIRMAMTATEAALYDQQLGGGLRSKMVSLSHQNLPLALFLETPDLGYPAWSGSRTTAASNADIISSLGLGIVRFQEAETPPPAVTTYDYEYQVNTEVITAVTVSGGQADPDHPVSVSFAIGSSSYSVSNVYYPEGDSQRVWVRWTTPSTPQTMTIRVSVTGGAASNQGTITARIVDLSGNDPPNPTANDRQDGFVRPALPSGEQNTTATWGVWRPWWQAYWVWRSNWRWIGDGQGGGYWLDLGRWVDEGWWRFDYDRFEASLSASMSLVPDEKNPTAAGKTMKSGYGVNQMVQAQVSTNQPSAVTGIQTAVTYFPEFQYQTYWRLLERLQSGLQSEFAFAANPYSTYNRRTHFTPIWMKDGAYTPYTKLLDSWTPAGMLRMSVNDSVTIQGNLWEDWHQAPVNP